MKLSSKQLRDLEPTLDEWDSPIETPEAYAQRVQQTLPNFPISVITQWFYEHHQTIEEHAGLDYPSLHFELVSVTSEILELPCLRDHETVAQYRDYYLKGTDSARMNRLGSYIVEHGTWPVPPLLFDNPDGRFVASWGFKYSIPYDLLEGHHRLAVLYALKKQQKGSHNVWLIQRESICPQV